MAEFMRQHFPNAGAAAESKTDFDASAESPEKPRRKAEFTFDYKPRDVKAYLDRFVIKQDEAKKVLSVALCDHYHHVRLALEGKETPNYAKQNIILHRADGRGQNLSHSQRRGFDRRAVCQGRRDEIFRDGLCGRRRGGPGARTVPPADGDVKRAQYGIIYIDEIDKIAAREQCHRARRERARRADQPAQAHGGNGSAGAVAQDIAGQIQAMMDMTQRGKKAAGTINTRHILFIVSGAFDGLEKSVQQAAARERPLVLPRRRARTEPDTQVLEQAQTRDFIELRF